tara:strand:+ start:1553 stop:2767 length:1215 start_codon:yes stop_codon:yes gene_type:complete
MRAQILVTLLFISLFFIPLAAPEGDESLNLVASKPLPQQSDADIVLHEHFLAKDGSHAGEYSSEMVHLSWWKWSDETNSDWPDDDALSRLGELGLEEGTNALYNEQVGDNLSLEEGLLLGREYSRIGPVLSLDGSVEIVSNENEQWFLRFPVVMTPFENLSDNTVLYFFVTEDSATDHHGRQASHLVRDMKPEIGFSNQQGNSTETIWEIPPEHLLAAGIDLQSDPYGWHITLAFFGEVEGDDTNRLLAMYHTSLPTRWENSNISHFALPIFLLLFASILASGAVSSALRREKGMPKLNAGWVPGDLVIARFTFQSGDKRVTLKSCETEPPWQIKGGFKSKRIPPHSEYIFSLRFKEMHETDCQISLGLEVEELGSWTQYLRLSTQHLPSNLEGQSVETYEDEQ